MASINASITSTGIVTSGDATGNLQLQSDGVTGLSILANGKINIANTALSTASAGTLEYDGGELYFTPLSTQRGIIPGMQYYVLNSAVVGANSTSNQNTFGVGVTLSSSTRYQFESTMAFVRSAGTTQHSMSLLFGGTATINNILYYVNEADWQGTMNTRITQANNLNVIMINVATATAITPPTVSASSQIIWVTLNGSVSINAGGTFIPQYVLSATPGGAYSTQIGSYFAIWPVGPSGSNISVGTWA